ncbi:MAG TPA: PEP-CTERM sorting domain-containing protein [Tepidisphaeraceae bacterium]|nr:PEP-CTERM sorting domain-containing protein [Tepidisphaeraceae bacterium]
MHKSIKMRLACAAGVALWAGSVAGAPVAQPYSEDFDDGVADDFSASAGYTIQADSPSGNVYQAVVGSSSGGANATSAVQVTNVVGSAFAVGTEFTVDSFTAAGTSTLNLGLGILSTTADLSSGNQYRILYTLGTGGDTGKITIQEGGTTRATSTGVIPVTQDVPYFLKVEVTYSGSNPTIMAYLTQGASEISATWTDTTTPFAGEFFGYRTAVNAVGGTVTENIDYDNFGVVPEPGSVGLLGAGAAGLLARRRRRRA